MRRLDLLRIDLPAGAGLVQPTILIVATKWLQ